MVIVPLSTGERDPLAAVCDLPSPHRRRAPHLPLPVTITTQGEPAKEEHHTTRLQ